MKREYIIPGNVDKDRLLIEAKKRREALVNAGCDTYVFGLKNGMSAILCLCCGLGSCNLNDIKLKYCGFCNVFHQEVKEDGEK